MINRRLHFLVPVSIIVLAALVWYFTSKRENPALEPKLDPTSKQVYKLGDRRVLNLPAGKEKETLETIKVSNTVSPEWEKSVVETLKAQGQDAVKDISVQKVESLIWFYHGLALNVESVAVTLKNEKGERTSFRALIDSQNGKILQTWDQPVRDSLNPRDNNIQIKIDPRYHD